MNKGITRKNQREIPKETAWLLRRTHGLRAEIARRGKFHRSFVTRVVEGIKRPSPRFLRALAAALYSMARKAEIEIVRGEYPEEFSQIAKDGTKRAR